MNDLDNEMQDKNDLEHSLWCAAMWGNLPLVKHIVDKGADLSSLHINTKDPTGKKLCVAKCVENELNDLEKTYLDDDYFENDPYDLWEGEGTMRRNELYPVICKMKEVYDYIREMTAKDHPHLVV